MTLLKDFISALSGIQAEAEGTHHNQGRVWVSFSLEHNGKWVSLELVPDSEDGMDLGVEPDRNLGCGCWTGATVNLRVRECDRTKLN